MVCAPRAEPDLVVLKRRADRSADSAHLASPTAFTACNGLTSAARQQTACVHHVLYDPTASLRRSGSRLFSWRAYYPFGGAHGRTKLRPRHFLLHVSRSLTMQLGPPLAVGARQVSP
jgi:hypothetical protein